MREKKKGNKVGGQGYLSRGTKDCLWDGVHSPANADLMNYSKPRFPHEMVLPCTPVTIPNKPPRLSREHSHHQGTFSSSWIVSDSTILINSNKRNSLWQTRLTFISSDKLEPYMYNIYYIQNLLYITHKINSKRIKFINVRAKTFNPLGKKNTKKLW